MEEIKITRNDSGQRADKFLKKYLAGAPAGFIYKMMRKKKIRLNGKKMHPSNVLSEGDIIQFYLSRETLSSFMPGGSIKKTGMDFKVVYEDSNIVVVDKPAGLLSHPHKKQEQTLIDQVVYYLYRKGEYDPDSENTFMPALCNRLDRNTGGLVIAAKNFQALRDMNCMIREKWVDKYYKSIVKGTINEESRIEGFLAKDESTNTVKIFDEQVEGSKEICTLYKPLKLNSQGFTLLEIKLITGKPHQIRAHLAYSGYPIVGDYKYGDRMVNRNFRESYGLKSQFLYAHRLIFSETTEFFEYLKGMEIRTELPHELEIIEEDLFR